MKAHDKQKRMRIYFTGVGGQGTLTATTLLARTALQAGLDVVAGEVHGMAQRGGVVESVLLLGGWRSPKLDFGEADLLLGFEPLETLRGLSYLRPGGAVFSSSDPLPPVSVSLGQASYPDMAHIKEELGIEADMREAVSYALYPKVYEDYWKSLEKDGDLSHVSSDIFFHGLVEGESGDVALEEGKVLAVKLIEVKDPDEEGNSHVTFEVNGARRVVSVLNEVATKSLEIVRKPIADQDNPSHVGANIPGTVIKINVKEGDEIKENQPLMVLEAMKMETNVLAPRDGVIHRIFVQEGNQVEAGELIAELEG